MQFTMDDERIFSSKEHTWNEIHSEIVKINTKLCELLDYIPSINKYKFIELLYPYGVDIIKAGKMYYPLASGGSTCIDDPLVPDNLKSNYPLVLTLKNKLEFYSPIGKRIVANKVVSPGEILGMARILNGSPSTLLSRYDLSSGVRNIIIPCKISDSRRHALMQKDYRGLISPAPTCMQDQHITFTELAMSSGWYSRLLLLPNELVTMLIQRDPSVAELRNYLVDLHRSFYGIGHHDSEMWDMILGKIAEDYNLAGYRDALEIVKQVLVIRAKSGPGFIPSTDESNGPLNYISTAYRSSYDILKLTNHDVLFMVSAQLNDHNSPIYYPLSYQTSLRYIHTTKSAFRVLELCLRVLDIYKKSIVNTDAKTRAPALYNAIINTKFEFYHPTPGDHNGIKNSLLLPEEDVRFKTKTGTFPSGSLFFTGIIKITPAKEK